MRTRASHPFSKRMASFNFCFNRSWCKAHAKCHDPLERLLGFSTQLQQTRTPSRFSYSVIAQTLVPPITKSPSTSSLHGPATTL